MGRCWLVLSIVAIAAPLSSGGTAAQTAPVDAAQILAAARRALGGDSELNAIKTIVATGRTRQIRGNNLVPIEFEVSCELPDRFVRRDEIPAQDADITVSGFVGDTLIQFPAPRPGGGSGPGGPPPAARLTQVKQDFARLMLGAFVASVSSHPLTFKYAAMAEAPEGRADILDVSGPDQFSARLVIQRETSLPVMLIWQPPAAAGRGGLPPATAGRGGSPSQPGASPPVEQRMYYGDFRQVGGVKWPFRIRRAAGTETVEEMTFDRVRFNVKIDQKKFESPK